MCVVTHKHENILSHMLTGRVTRMHVGYTEQGTGENPMHTDKHHTNNVNTLTDADTHTHTETHTQSSMWQAAAAAVCIIRMF